MKYGKSVIAVLALIALLVGLSGCAKEGPMEKAGKKVDKAKQFRSGISSRIRTFQSLRTLATPFL